MVGTAHPTDWIPARNARSGVPYAVGVGSEIRVDACDS